MKYLIRFFCFLPLLSFAQTENFDSGVFPPLAPFNITTPVWGGGTNSGDPATWYRSDDPIIFGSVGNNGLDVGYGGSGNCAILYSNMFDGYQCCAFEVDLLLNDIDISAYTQPRLKFYIKHPDGEEQLEIAVSNFAGPFVSLQTLTSNYNDWTAITVDLSAYSGSSNLTIRFRGLDPNGNTDATNVGIDNIIIEEQTPMVYGSSQAIQQTCAFNQGDIHASVISIEVDMNGSLNPVDLTQFSLTTNGTTLNSDIIAARLYYTGSNNVFSTNNLFGSFTTPSGSFVVNGTQTLEEGTNYFWLAYELSIDASIGNVFDAECIDITVDATTETPTISAPGGANVLNNNGVFLVTNLNASGSGSLRAAVDAAKVYGCDAIVDARHVFGTIYLTSNISIFSNNNITILGSGADNLILDGASNSSQAFYHNGAGTVTIKDFQFANHSSSYPIYTPSSYTIVKDCYFNSNIGANIRAIYVPNGKLDVFNSTFYNNSCTNSFAGAIYSPNAIVYLSNCTFDNNWSYEGGGAIYHPSGTLTIDQCTFTNNHANNNSSTYNGGAIHNTVPIIVTNSIFDNNTCQGSVTELNISGTVNMDYSFMHNSAGTTIIGGNNQIATVSGLTTIGMNGGRTPTIPISVGANTINTGDGLNTTQTDQRHYCRVGTNDMGAYEFQGTVTEVINVSVTVSNSTICSGESITVTATASNTGANPYYYWTINGDIVAGSTASTYSSSAVADGDYLGCILSSDVNDCEANKILSYSNLVNIIVTDAIVVSTNTDNNPPCFGLPDGVVSASGTGGTVAVDYTYSWSSGGSAAVETNLVAGSYTVTLTDDNGCSGIGQVTVTEPTVVSSVITSTNESCFGLSDGQISVTGAGGTVAVDYSYNWASGNTTASATGLAAGTYNVTLTDDNGCTGVGNALINSGPSITANIMTSDACLGVSSFFNASGSSHSLGSPLTYNWDFGDGGTGGGINSVYTYSGVGSYTVIVTATDGTCNDVVSANAIVHDIPTTSIVSTNVTCNGVCDGTVDATGSGGDGGPYMHSWNNGLSNGPSHAMLCGGTYIVTVTDGNNCTAEASVVISEPSPVSLALSASFDNFCFGASNGVAFVDGAGGTVAVDHSYSWSSGSTSATATGLAAGTYTVTTSDDNSCFAVDTFNITQPATAITISTTIDNHVSCFGLADGQASVSGAGGTVAVDYSYSWSSGDTVVTANGLAAGTYTVTIADDNNCFDIDTINITQPNAITISSTIDNHISCFGLADGQASVSGAGGTVAVDYSYSWSSGNTTAAATGLAAGSYIVTLSDDNSCFAVDTITITQPTSSVSFASIASVNNFCYGASNGMASVSGTGGTVAVDYSYSWSSGNTTASATGLAAGSYIVTLSDDNSCFAVDTINISQPAAITISTVVDNNVSCFGLADGQASVSGSGGTVAVDYSYSWSSSNTTASATGLAAGSYIVTLSDDNSCFAVDTINISQPAAITISTLVDNNVSCFGLADGQASVSGSGGTVAVDYSYSWSSGNTAAAATGLAAGNYIVTLSDDNSCLDIDTINITQPTAITISSTIDNNISCFGLADGQASVSGAGGTVAIDYSYGWSSGNNAATATGLSSGAYSVTVADDNGCFATDNFNLSQPSALSITQNCTNTSALGSSDGGSIASLAGGTTPYFYVWSTGDSVSSLTGIPAGSYSVTASDINGCAQIANCSVSGPPYIALSVTSNISDVICNGGVDGSINLVISGGTTPFSFVWSNNSITQNVTGLNSGLYSVTVSDGITTAVLSDLNLSEPPQIEIDFTSIPDTICPGGEVIITASGGTDYDWINEGSTSSALTVLVDSGRYFLVETTIGTCSAIDSIYIPVLSASDCASLSNLDPPNAFSPDGDGTNDSWIIQGIEFTDNKVTIFNRWGDNIGEFENYDNSSVVWSGTNKSGELLPTGTYFYVIEIDGVITKRDWIQIVR